MTIKEISALIEFKRAEIESLERQLSDKIYEELYVLVDRDGLKEAIINKAKKEHKDIGTDVKVWIVSEHAYNNKIMNPAKHYVYLNSQTLGLRFNGYVEDDRLRGDKKFALRLDK